MTKIVSLAAVVVVLGLAATSARTVQGVADSTSDPHAYFNALVERADHVVSYSLRDPAQVAFARDGGYTLGSTEPRAVTYDPANDPDPRRQDAAKVLIGAGTTVNLRHQVRLPLRSQGVGFLVTWDVWMGQEFEQVATYKHFQLDGYDDRIWTEIRSRFSLGRTYFPGSLALTDIRVYEGSGTPRHSEIWENGQKVNYGTDSLGSQLANFPTYPETWTRYWVQISPRADDAEWWDFSMWMADETRDAVQLFDKVSVKPRDQTGWHKLWLEYNSSKARAEAGGEMTSYVRNVVVLQPQASPATVLQRPYAGLPLPPLPRPGTPVNLRQILSPQP